MATTEPISASKTETPWPSSRRRTSRRSWGCYRLRRRKTHVRLGHHCLPDRNSCLGRGSDAGRCAAHLAELAPTASLAPPDEPPLVGRSRVEAGYPSLAARRRGEGEARRTGQRPPPPLHAQSERRACIGLISAG